MANKPVLHAHDHQHGGADPVRITWESTGEAGPGGGIQFDTTPQEGEFLQVTTSDYMNIETEGSSPLNIDANGTGDINLFSAGGDITMSADSGVVIDGHGDDGIILDADGGGDIVIHASGGSASNIIIWAGGGTHAIILKGLPSSDPHVADQIWSNGGVVTISAG